jgi:hypothetical protein
MPSILPDIKYDTKFKKELRKTCIIAQLFLQTIINICIEVIFPTIITYLDRTFKEEQNEIILLNKIKF